MLALNFIKRKLFWQESDRDNYVKINLECLNRISPFFAITNRNGFTIHAGRSLIKLLRYNPEGLFLNELVIPSEVEGEEENPAKSAAFKKGNLHEITNTTLTFYSKAYPEIKLAGQIVGLGSHDSDGYMVELRPIIETLSDLNSIGMTLQDLSLTDPIRTNLISILMSQSLQDNLLNGLRLD